MKHNDEHPLISVALMTYNQERYVKEALQSVLNQTYANIEIIVSDDCSQDGTWDVVQKEVNAYRANGSVHDIIVLNRNASNMGVARHFELILSKCHGEFVVCQAGDDASFPERVELIVEAIKSKPGVAIVYHEGVCIDGDGNVVGANTMRTSVLMPLGAMMAYSRRVYEEFEPISERGAWEDDVYARRAQMLGSEIQIKRALLKYRVGCGGISSNRDDVAVRRSRVASGCLASARQSRRDLEYCKSKLTPEKYSEVLRDINWYEERYSAEYEMYNGASWAVRFRAFCILYRNYSLLGRLNGFIEKMLPSWVSKGLSPLVWGAKKVLRHSKREVCHD